MSDIGPLGQVTGQVVGLGPAIKGATYLAAYAAPKVVGAIRDYNDKPVSPVRGSRNGKPIKDAIDVNSWETSKGSGGTGAAENLIADA